jgi:hypothetical protein
MATSLLNGLVHGKPLKPPTIYIVHKADIFGLFRAGALLAPHLDSGFQELQIASLNFYRHLLKTAPESGVKVGRSPTPFYLGAD